MDGSIFHFSVVLFTVFFIATKRVNSYETTHAVGCHYIIFENLSAIRVWFQRRLFWHRPTSFLTAQQQQPKIVILSAAFLLFSPTGNPSTDY